MPERELPRFADLPLHADAPPGSSWSVWGDDDEIGTLNLIEAEHVAAAARLVRRGAVFPLNWDLALPSPAFFLRENPRHVMIEKYGGSATDDYLEGFWPQASSQWDGLRHFGDPDWGFYNRATLTEVMTEGAGRLGIEKWAERGIAARGVLLDVARLLDADGVERDPFDWYPIDVALLTRTAAEQGVSLGRGDVLVVRTGWIEAYEQLDEVGRQALAAEGRDPAARASSATTCRRSSGTPGSPPSRRTTRRSRPAIGRRAPTCRSTGR
ncbi:MAG: cyclase family protein [Thermoleophilia bacterium]